jgi:hypothetical protein
MATLAKMARTAAKREAEFNAAWQSLFADMGDNDLYVGRSPCRTMPRLKLVVVAIRGAWWL